MKTEKNKKAEIKKIRETLLSMQDPKYREMQVKIIPNISADSIIGVRTPALRDYAKKLAKEEAGEVFLKDLPHRYFEENQLHAFIISGKKDYDSCMEEVNRFLPCVDNWATCDQMSPKVFVKHRKELLSHIRQWTSPESSTYEIRFGIKMLMDHFLDEDYNPGYPEMVAGLRSGEYYVNMMIAWYFATALAKQYESVLPFIEAHRLEAWTHNKAIQKAVESYRITAEQKEYLKSLKILRKKETKES